MSKEKKKSTFDKILMGVIIGGAVGSVVGAAATNKEVRDKIRAQLANTSEVVKDVIEGQKKDEKSFWHRLNRAFFKK